MGVFLPGKGKNLALNLNYVLVFRQMYSLCTRFLKKQVHANALIINDYALNVLNVLNIIKISLLDNEKIKINF